MADDDDVARIFDLEWIRQLAELMEAHDLREIELGRDDQLIRLSRGQLPTVGVSSPGPAPALPATPQSAPPAPEAESKSTVYIRSPMVGTFYARSNPKAAAYVKVGDHIAPETTVCIIEAMKVFNEIPADVRGQVVAVLVDDEEPVDVGKPLFKVDTSK